MEGVKTVKNKFLSIIISITTLFTLTACQVNNSTNNDNDKIQIVTTIFPQYDFAKNISGDNAEVTLLLSPGAESHSFEPTAADIATIQQADLFIYTGGQSEIWVDKILDSNGNKSNAIRLFDYVTPLEAEHGHEHEHGNEYDEHIFTSLKNSVILLDVISEKMCEADTENADEYKKNAEAYKKELEKLDNDFSEMISSAKRNTIVFGDRFPFRYFTQDYSLEWHAAFSGCSSETEASPATISKLIEIVKEEEIPTIFHIEFSNKSIAEKIAQATNTEIECLHSCHNISKEDFENDVTYLKLVKQNYDVLSEALN